MKPFLHCFRTAICPWFALAAIAVAPAEAKALTASDIYVGTVNAQGVRPLLTILVDFTDATFPSAYTPSYYRQLLFGSDGVVPLQPNVAGIGGYFHYASNWSFRFRDAGIVGPFTALNDSTTPGDDSTWSCLIGGDDSKGACPAGPANDKSAYTYIRNALQAAANQVRFRDFDSNGDGIITSNELSVLIIEAVPKIDEYWGGAHRGSNPRTFTLTTGLTPGVSLNLNAALVRQPGDITTFIHEMTHNIGIGTPEPYGSASSNRNVAMMSSVESAVDGRSTVLYDPYIRMKLGWLTPHFLSMNGTTDFDITATNDPYDKDRRAFVLHDSAHGNREFFVLEYRTKMNRRKLSSNFVELHTLWSPSETNHAMTVDTNFNGVPGTQFTIYGKQFLYKRSEGWIATQYQQGLRLFAAWRSPSRQDDLATSEYLPTAGSPLPDYQGGTILGYVYQSSSTQAGLIRLTRWWNPTTLDMYTTTDPDWIATTGSETKDGYTAKLNEGKVTWAPDLNYDDDPWGTGHTRLPDEGLAIWHVRLNPAAQYFQAFPAQPVAAGDVPLTRWWSAQRGDNFDTDMWPPQKTTPTLDYVYGGEIGRLYAAPGTGRKKMWLWYNDTRGDNFSTTDPAWEGTTPGQTRLGYRYVGLIGYVTETEIGESKVPLYSYWHPQREDNMVSTEESVPGYTRVRREGYIRPALVDAGLYIVPPGGQLEGHPGTNALWTSADGSATLKWFDGATACTVKVLTTSTVGRTITVRIN